MPRSITSSNASYEVSKSKIQSQDESDSYQSLRYANASEQETNSHEMATSASYSKLTTSKLSDKVEANNIIETPTAEALEDTIEQVEAVGTDKRENAMERQTRKSHPYPDFISFQENAFCALPTESGIERSSWYYLRFRLWSTCCCLDAVN